ncbi:hypothetical protein GCM10009826_01090 [Humibacillus xanthopallidus]
MAVEQRPKESRGQATEVHRVALRGGHTAAAVEAHWRRVLPAGDSLWFLAVRAFMVGTGPSLTGTSCGTASFGR